MDFTFGIITKNNRFVSTIINSIKSQNIPNCEIIVVGGAPINDCIYIPFDETIKENWITRKKNIITKLANFENIVYMHDYIKLEPDWYEGFLNYGNDFDACMTKMVELNGVRYRDWTLCCWAPILHILGKKRRCERLLPYNITQFSDLMYFSGAYWVAKKHIMEKFPLNEDLCWGDGEDTDWSYRIRRYTKFSINAHSTVRLMVIKNSGWAEMKKDMLDKFLNMPKEEYQQLLKDADEVFFRYLGRYPIHETNIS